MNQMEINYKHGLTREQAYTRIDRFLSELQKEYSDRINNPRKDWNPEHTQMKFEMGIMGFDGIKGTISLYEGEIQVVGKIPFLARPFSGKIEQIIRKQLEYLF